MLNNILNQMDEVLLKMRYLQRRRLERKEFHKCVSGNSLTYEQKKKFMIFGEGMQALMKSSTNSIMRKQVFFLLSIFQMNFGIHILTHIIMIKMKRRRSTTNAIMIDIFLMYKCLGLLQDVSMVAG